MYKPVVIIQQSSLFSPLLLFKNSFILCKLMQGWTHTDKMFSGGVGAPLSLTVSFRKPDSC